jgi:putative phage-type endonuclease
MSAILKLVQGTPAWHAHRATSRNASETPAVLGVSPWQTPYSLWLLRTGRKVQEVTPAMTHGSELEPAARAAYEKLTGQILEPLVLQEGEYSASLDGITLDGSLILEVKCPFKGRTSELWKSVAAGVIPEHYGWQLEHQLMVAGAALAHLWVFDGTEGILLDVKPKPETWPRITKAWDEFSKYLETDTPPPLTDKDVRLREDQEWRAAAQAYIAAKAHAEVTATAVDDAKAALIALASHTSEAGAGVKVSRFWKLGSVDYKKIPQLKGVDLEPYRGPDREEVRVTVG